MAAEPNIFGLVRILFVAAGVALACWALWGADPGWTKLTWLTVGGVVLVLGIIGYSPLHALLRRKDQKVS